MKIVQFIDSMYTGGAETSVCNTALEMKRQGLDVTVLCFSIRRNTGNEERLDSAGIRTVYLADKCMEALHFERFHDTFIRFFVMLFLLVPVFRARIRQDSPDVLHMHLDALLFYPFIPKNIKKNIKAFWTIHSEPDIYLRKGIVSRIRKIILKRYPNIEVLTLNKISKTRFDEYRFKNQSAIIQNGFELYRFQSGHSYNLDKRTELDVKKNAFVIGHVGRFGDGEAIKNQGYLVDLFGKIVTMEPEAILMLIGGGEPSVSLNNKISSASLSDRVLLLSNRSDVSELMGMMDVFVFPSKYEGFPMTLLEAQAAGLRCVVSDAVTKETALTDKMCYLSLDAGDDVWINAILHGEQMETPHGRLEDYNIENVVHKLMELYSA